LLESLDCGIFGNEKKIRLSLKKKPTNSSSVSNFYKGIGKLLSEHAQAVRLVQQVYEDVVGDYQRHMLVYEENLKKSTK
jgi:hypothetical protein